MNDYSGAFWDTPLGIVAKIVEWISLVLLALAAACYMAARIRLHFIVKQLDKDGKGDLRTRIRRVLASPGKLRD